METLNRAEPGTVSHGTLRPEDLLEAFADALEHLVQDNANAWCSDAGRSSRDFYLNLVWRAREQDETLDDQDLLVDELSDALDEFAPDGHYFGAHPGDGADFGYWPSEED